MIHYVLLSLRKSIFHETTRNDTKTENNFASLVSCCFVWFRGSFPFVSHLIKTDLKAPHLLPDGRLDGYAFFQIPSSGFQRPLAGVSHLAARRGITDALDDLVGDARRRPGFVERREVEGDEDLRESRLLVGVCGQLVRGAP